MLSTIKSNYYYLTLDMCKDIKNDNNLMDELNNYDLNMICKYNKIKYNNKKNINSLTNKDLLKLIMKFINDRYDNGLYNIEDLYYIDIEKLIDLCVLLNLDNESCKKTNLINYIKASWQWERYQNNLPIEDIYIPKPKFQKTKKIIKTSIESKMDKLQNGLFLVEFDGLI